MFLVVAAVIKWSSPGPVFFTQERIGFNKRRFGMLKFRTMVNGAHKEQEKLEELNEADGPVFKIRNDPRVTPIGKFLRRFSIDELPQLINVLMGDMSLVGPRPLPVRDVERIDVASHKRRFSIKPGLTCLWQVNGRSDVGFEEWVRMDLQYIDQWSLGLDILILLKTIPAVFRGPGAY
jgi:lipopolysaccharide/colanic/teichoic acid biosynthesis glycosyltransferase